MIHLFLLIVMINGTVSSQDMYFRSINECNWYANAIVSGQRKNGYLPDQANVGAYCVPKLVPENNNLKVY